MSWQSTTQPLFKRKVGYLEYNIMRELNVNEIKEVNGGMKSLGWALLGYVGTKIADGAQDMWNNRSTRSSTGGQMNRARRSNMFNP